MTPRGPYTHLGIGREDHAKVAPEGHDDHAAEEHDRDAKEEADSRRQTRLVVGVFLVVVVVGTEMEQDR
jgi:hypothetical protein